MLSGVEWSGVESGEASEGVSESSVVLVATRETDERSCCNRASRLDGKTDDFEDKKRMRTLSRPKGSSLKPKSKGAKKSCISI
jgi:hypothetical protein